MAEADAKISALTAITSADSADELLVIDKSDTTDGLGGTGKKITASNFKADLVAKVSTTVADNIPTFSNTSGSLKDSGKKLADYSLTTHNHSGVYEPADVSIQSHLSNTSNPHSVTYSQVGAASSSHNHTGTYEPANTNIQSHISDTANPHSVTASQVGAVATNVAIVGATKTKITYDAKGLVTSGADATTADVADSTDKRYVTEAEKTKLSNLSGTNTGDQVVPTTEDIQDTVGGMVTGNTESGISVEYDDTNGKLNFTVTASGSGDVTGPSSATADNIVTFNGTTGKIIKDSTSKVSDFATASHNHTGIYAPVLGADDNYVTDAEKTKLSNLSGTNTGDQDLSGYVPTSRTVNSKALTSNISLTASDVGAKATGADETANVSAASDTAAGKVELATASETTTGTDTGRAVTPDGLAGSTIFGVKTVQITCFDYATSTATGDGKGYIVIPASLNGMNLVSVHAKVITAGTTNTTDIQIANVTDSQDMLSTKLTIDSGETGSDTAATAAVINTSYDDVATNDLLRIDVDAVSTTAAKGLIVTLGFQLP